MGSNKVNNLNGKEWLKNAINFWSFANNNIEDVFNRFLSFCYKDRTNTGYNKNINSYETKGSDFTFNYIKNFQDVDKALLNVINGKYNSYHVIYLEEEIIDDYFMPEIITKSLNINKIEYRGKIVIHYNDTNCNKIALLFLNRLEESANVNKVIAQRINHRSCVSYVITSKSKIDKIGIMHPAPFSYLDIENIIEKEKISNKIILDPFLGIGSTIIGGFKNNYVYGIELNKNYVELIPERYNLLKLPNEIYNKSTIICGDSKKKIETIKEKIDVVITSPPYFNILKNKTTGIRTDNSQTRQGIEYYSDSDDDIGNLNNYQDYLNIMKNIFTAIKKKMNCSGNIYLIISDFTINKKETDVHSDFIRILNECGFAYCGTSYILQNQKAIYPFGYPYKIVINHIYQYIIKFKLNEY